MQGKNADKGASHFLSMTCLARYALPAAARGYVAQPSSAASFRTVSVRPPSGGGTPPELAGEDACATTSALGQASSPQCSKSEMRPMVAGVNQLLKGFFVWTSDGGVQPRHAPTCQRRFYLSERDAR